MGEWKVRLSKVRAELAGVQDTLEPGKPVNVATLTKCLRTVVGVLIRVIDVFE